MVLRPHEVARALGGTVSGRNIVAPGPGHSRRDRSLSVRLDPAAPEGFVLHSFAGDSQVVCRAYVRAALDLPQRSGPLKRSAQPRSHFTGYERRGGDVGRGEDAARRSAIALQIWEQARDPRGTVVDNYFASRDLTLTDEIAGSVLRFHPSLRLDGRPVGGMVALFRDVRTDEPRGILRTFLDSAGRKLDRRMLGRVSNAAIKIDAEEDVTAALHIGEGVESCVAARLAGFSPVWALGSAGAIATFPVLAGIEVITVLGEVDDGGANARAAQRCADRWIAAGREALIVVPQVGNDLNDVWREVVDGD